MLRALLLFFNGLHFMATLKALQPLDLRVGLVFWLPETGYHFGIDWANSPKNCKNRLIFLNGHGIINKNFELDMHYAVNICGKLVTLLVALRIVSAEHLRFQGFFEVADGSSPIFRIHLKDRNP